MLVVRGYGVVAECDCSEFIKCPTSGIGASHLINFQILKQDSALGKTMSKITKHDTDQETRQTDKENRVEGNRRMD